MVNGINNQQSPIEQVSSTQQSTSKSGSAQSNQTIGNCNPCTNCGKCGKAQDPSTVTQEQLKSPIDLRV